MTNEQKGSGVLGRGLDSLIGKTGLLERNGPEVMSVPIDSIVPNPNQPRRLFPAGELEELAASITSQGVIQPLIVRAHPQQVDKLQIVAGERRWRAAQLAGQEKVPVLRRALTDAECLLVAIVENVHRSDLNAIDEAFAYQGLMKEFGWTQQQLASRIGKSRSHVANSVRLINLPESIQEKVRNNRLSAGHARTLLSAPDPAKLATKVLTQQLSVRQTERLVSKQAQATAATANPRPGRKSPDTAILEAAIAANLKAKVSIVLSERGHSGKLVIRFSTTKQLEKLYSQLVHGKVRQGSSDQTDH